MKLGFLTLGFKAADAGLKDDGWFSGYLSVFGEVDSYREVVQKGAFAKSLKAWAKRGKLPAMLLGHDTKRVIGKWLVMREDAKGLYVEGQLALGTTDGKNTYELMKMDAIDGLSIGFAATEWLVNEKTEVVTLTVIDLWEGSVVVFPAGPSARIDNVKSRAGYGALPTIREFEEILGDLGFSIKDSEHIAARGFRSLLTQGEPVKKKSEFTLEDIQNIILTK